MMAHAVEDGFEQTKAVLGSGGVMVAGFHALDKRFLSSNDPFAPPNMTSRQRQIGIRVRHALTP